MNQNLVHQTLSANHSGVVKTTFSPVLCHRSSYSLPDSIACPHEKLSGIECRLDWEQSPILFFSYSVDPRAECGRTGLSSVLEADCLQGLCRPVKLWMNITYDLLKRLQIWYTFTGLKKRNPSSSNCYVLTQVRLWETVLAQLKKVHKFFCYICITECRDSWHQWGCSNDPLNHKNEGNKCLALISGACSH